MKSLSDNQKSFTRGNSAAMSLLTIGILSMTIRSTSFPNMIRIPAQNSPYKESALAVILENLTSSITPPNLSSIPSNIMLTTLESRVTSDAFSAKSPELRSLTRV